MKTGLQNFNQTPHLSHIKTEVSAANHLKMLREQNRHAGNEKTETKCGSTSPTELTELAWPAVGVPFILTGGWLKWGGWSWSQLPLGVAGYTLDRSPVHHVTLTDNLESPVNPTRMSLACGRKPTQKQETPHGKTLVQARNQTLAVLVLITDRPTMPPNCWHTLWI